MPGLGKKAKTEAQWARESYECALSGGTLGLKNPKSGRAHEECKIGLPKAWQKQNDSIDDRRLPSVVVEWMRLRLARRRSRVVQAFYSQIWSARRGRHSRLESPPPRPRGSMCPTASQSSPSP